MMIISQNFQ